MNKRKNKPTDNHVVRAVCDGVPLYSYGYTSILGQSPDLIDDPLVQKGNDSPLRKIQPKKSWEIRSNRLGATAPRMPRTPENDYLPLEAIHLIDGDVQTCWSSEGQAQPDVEPIWIRLDLPVERDISKVVLRKRPPGPKRGIVGSVSLDEGAVEVGMGVPAELTIKISRDGWHWETVFEGPSGDAPDRLEFEFTFDARPAKQIWIIGRNLPRVENWGFSFSIAEVEVLSPQGDNLALATRGTGITVNSTHHTPGEPLVAHQWYWPIHYDLGLKWVRVGYHDDTINWHWVEKEKGKLVLDPATDQAITDLVDHGIDVVMALDGGNRHYTHKDPTRKLPQLWEWYYENPLPPTTPEALEAWKRYVRFMAEKFCGRVKVFEVWNEWNINLYWGGLVNIDHYLAVARAAIPILREVCPKAKIMLGSVSHLGWEDSCFGMAGWSEDELARKADETLFLQAVRALGRDVDLIGWHPFYQHDPELPVVRSYTADVRAFKEFCRAEGFGGEFMVTEWSYGAHYPPTTVPTWWGDFEPSELQKAKYIAQVTVKHTALGMESFYCETWNTVYPLDLSLMRRSFTADPISPIQPQAAYYVTRNLATALEDLQPADEVKFHLEPSPDKLETFAMKRKGETVLAVWTAGRAGDSCEGSPCDVVVDGTFSEAEGYDPLNGTAHTLNTKRKSGQTVLPGILVKDYPILLRLRV